MELRAAKLCLDCEEVHTDPMCPVCASESFAYLTRWVPLADRPPQARRAAAVAEAAEAEEAAPSGTRGKQTMRWARRGAAGVVLVAISQWLWRTSRPVEWGESGSGNEDEAAKRD